MTTYTADRTPNDRGVSGWYGILPPPGPARVLEEHITADWVIIGAGFAGLSAARRLTQLRGGDKVVVLEAQRIAEGTSGRNSGFMIDLPHELQSEDLGSSDDEADIHKGVKREIEMNRAAIDFAGEAVEEFGLEKHFKRCGKIHGAVDKVGVQSLKNYESYLDQIGEPYESMDAAEMKRITGMDYYTGGMLAPRSAQIQPAAYIRGLADGLRNKVSIYENSAVRRIETGKRHVVHTALGSVTCDKVILTVNGQAESFGLYKRRFMHLGLFGSMTRELTPQEAKTLGGEPEWGIIAAHPLGSSIRRLPEGRIVVRNMVIYNPSREASQAQIDRFGRQHDKSFAARFPMLPAVEMEYRWSGHLCLSRNSAPAFGEVEERVYSACCQNGLGTVKGTLSGMLIVELASGSNNPMILDFQAKGEPSKLFPEPFMSIGAKSYLWWVQSRAGRDI